MELYLPLCVMEALSRLEQAGWQAYAVGGCVRDMLLGHTPNDWDIATNALPAQTQAVFKGEKIVPTGLRHGTVTVLLQGQPLEITTYRVDGPYSDGRRPNYVRFTACIEEDLARRDFTVNAMAFSPRHGLRDPFGGREDLKGKKLRAVGRPELRFQEDALRVLRGIRFSACLGFSIEAQTAAAMERCAPLLGCISQERIEAEMMKLCCGRHTSQALEQYGGLLYSLPVWQGMSPRGWYSSILSRLEPAPALRLAALLWEGFGSKGEQVLHGLRCSKRLKEEAAKLLAFMGTPLPASRYEAKKAMAPLGQTLGGLALQWCAAAAPGGEEALLLCRQVLAENVCLCRSQLAVSGRELTAAGFPTGKAMGQLLDYLLEAVLREEVPNTHEALLSLAKSCRKNSLST